MKLVKIGRPLGKIPTGRQGENRTHIMIPVVREYRDKVNKFAKDKNISTRQFILGLIEQEMSKGD